jgi:tetratricopeptide (TPR) repeat protein
MKPRQTSVSDRALSRLLWAAVLVLVVGIPTFGVIYYRDQYADHGSTLMERQVQAAEKAVRTAPGNISVRLQLAQVYRSANRPDSALAQYDETLKADRLNRAALLGRGDVLAAKGDLTQAAKSYQKMVGNVGKAEFAANDPQLAEAYSALGRIALRQGRAKEAVTKLESAVKIDPGDADAWYALGTANAKAGAPKRAVAAFRTALRFVPTDWCDPYIQLNQAYKQLGDKPQAEYAGAMVDFCQKRPADAKRRLETLTSGPVAVDSMLGLGMIAEKASDRKGAASWYQKVLSKDAKNFNARNGLGRLSAGKTG